MRSLPCIDFLKQAVCVLLQFNHMHHILLEIEGEMFRIWHQKYKYRLLHVLKKGERNCKDAVHQRGSN